MDKEVYSTKDYAKLFFLMAIPIYGFCFTALLAFSKDVEGEMKNLARDAFIVRLVVLVVLGIGLAIFFVKILPHMENFMNSIVNNAKQFMIYR